MRRRLIDDYFVALVPEGTDVADPDVYPALLARMEREAVRATMAQYRGPRPKALLLDPIEWLVTDDPDEVERFQPAHDCEQCRAGNAAASEFLTANPGRFVACANLHYSEVWT
jgi:hypothetical protein